MDSIVTAVYKIDPYKREGIENAFTRNFDAENYVTGVRSLLGMDKDVYVFCNEQPVPYKGDMCMFEEICDHAMKDKYNYDRLHFIPLDVSSFFTRNDRLWEKCISLANRNPNNLYCWHPPLCLSRLEMMERVIEHYDAENICWFDAGLFNDSYFPGGTMHDYELQEWDTLYPNEPNCIFRPELANKIFEIIEDTGNFTVGNKSINQEPYEFIKKHLNKSISRAYSNVGCVLGFSKEYLQGLMYEYNHALDLFIDKYDYAFTEIEVLTYLDYKRHFTKLLWTNCEPYVDNEMTMCNAFANRIYDISTYERVDALGL